MWIWANLAIVTVFKHECDKVIINIAVFNFLVLMSATLDSLLYEGIGRTTHTWILARIPVAHTAISFRNAILFPGAVFFSMLAISFDVSSLFNVVSKPAKAFLLVPLPSIWLFRNKDVILELRKQNWWIKVGGLTCWFHVYQVHEGFLLALESYSSNSHPKSSSASSSHLKPMTFSTPLIMPLKIPG